MTMVWPVYAGEYEPDVVAVFTDEAKAQAYVDAHPVEVIRPGYQTGGITKHPTDRHPQTSKPYEVPAITTSPHAVGEPLPLDPSPSR